MKKLFLFAVPFALVVSACASDGVESTSDTNSLSEVSGRDLSPGLSESTQSTSSDSSLEAPIENSGVTVTSVGQESNNPAPTESNAPLATQTAPAPTSAPTTAALATAAPTEVPATQAKPKPVANLGIGPIEAEIVRLTNELRTNPNGPLKREGKVINCGGRVALSENGQGYKSVPALTVSVDASIKVARPWSAQMSVSNFEHQPRAGMNSLSAAGIEVRSAGENIAYHSYRDKALNHFTGWRESDGHFCNMMSANFTHIGVGEDTHSGLSFATQNFFTPR